MTGPRPKPTPERPSLEAVLAAAARASGFGQEQIRRRETLRVLPAVRNVTVRLMVERCGLGYREIGEFMDGRLFQTAQQMSERAKLQMERSANLRELYREIARTLPGGAPPEPGDPRKLARPRKCLMCAKGFQSSGAGERICKSCKATSVWKSGNHFALYPK